MPSPLWLIHAATTSGHTPQYGPHVQVNNTFYYPTVLRRVQITPKTSTNITRYLYSRGPVRQVFSQGASDEWRRADVLKIDYVTFGPPAKVGQTLLKIQ